MYFCLETKEWVQKGDSRCPPVPEGRLTGSAEAECRLYGGTHAGNGICRGDAHSDTRCGAGRSFDAAAGVCVDVFPGSCHAGGKGGKCRD